MGKESGSIGMVDGENNAMSNSTGSMNKNINNASNYINNINNNINNMSNDINNIDNNVNNINNGINYVNNSVNNGTNNYASNSANSNGLPLKFYNGLGGFSNDGREYIIYLKNNQATPAPWVNVISNRNFGFIVSESGGGYTWAENSRENRLTAWSNDWVTDSQGEVIYVKDNDSGEYWSITPSPSRNKDLYVIKHGFGYSTFENRHEDLWQELLLFMPVNDTVKISLVTLFNESGKGKKLSMYYYINPVLGVHEKDTMQYVRARMDKETGIVTAENPFNAEFPGRLAFVESSLPKDSYTFDYLEFVGAYGSLKNPVCFGSANKSKLSCSGEMGFAPCIAIQVNVELEPGERKELVFLLGQGRDMGEVVNLCGKYTDTGNAREELKKVKKLWEDKLGTIQVNTPDEAMNIILNGWLLYQAISCRLWARSAFYQSGGAVGFRDQLQDVTALVYAWPELTWEQILLHSSRQFIEGDVQHWWHKESGKGVRTRISDDLLWLPYVVADYVSCTSDWDVLKEEVPYIEDELLGEGENERYGMPAVSEKKDSVYGHCIKAIEKTLDRGFGEHGLPLMGSGDWNDGMNMVGVKGKGESVWLGWFLCTAMKNFIPICEKVGDKELAGHFKELIGQIVMAIEEKAWDGSWYLRAYFDDGKPLGSSRNSECKIDSIAQSWAIISGLGKPERTREALNAVENHLVDRDAGIIKLFAPPFDKSDLEPGYIKGYVPGVRENGGQYTHAAVWVVLAFAKLGEGDKAYELFSMINPINHSRTPIEIAQYKTEPYVLAADVYATPPNTGRGGWTWYTGAAGWMYRVGIEHILGIKKRGESLVIDPCIPSDWPEYSVVYKYGSSVYEIHVKNPEKTCRGVKYIIMDGEKIKLNKGAGSFAHSSHDKDASSLRRVSRGKETGCFYHVPLFKDDGKKHVVEVFMGT
ncbi:MAG: hypothetical protein GX754_04870 [Clostridiaceae bacterium]|nr:hypothetical protein [Clostridiaceae bacterium]